MGQCLNTSGRSPKGSYRIEVHHEHGQVGPDGGAFCRADAAEAAAARASICQGQVRRCQRIVFAAERRNVLELAWWMCRHNAGMQAAAEGGDELVRTSKKWHCLHVDQTRVVALLF